jgi:2-oxoglutarate ferredoxin oxidoreductase subunit alpha
LWPFPADPLVAAAKRGARFLVVEMSWGQMVEDVKLALYGTPRPVDLFWKSGGGVPGVAEVIERIRALARAK